MAKIRVEKGSGNVFLDIGFTPAEAAELAAKCELMVAIKDVIVRRKLTRRKAATLCRTDQRALASLLRGRMDHVTVSQLERWRAALASARG
ncbi:MAG TPA: XRE family transcriptional regulator [Stellaceae bacterium]|nr:XRE family transcriptional regulator [Stellaceae bacterium]